MALHEKLAEVMAEVGYVQKDSRNDFHKYKYASAEAVLKKVNAALSSRGIAVSSEAELVHYGEGSAVVKLSLTFHDGDESLTVCGLGEGSDKGDKATMKANTAALKYAMANAFLISWGDDPEADVTTDQRVNYEPVEDEFLPSYPEALSVERAMAGKRGVKELRQFFGHCAVQEWAWEDVEAFASEQGVNLMGTITQTDCIKLRDMMKHRKG